MSLWCNKSFASAIKDNMQATSCWCSCNGIGTHYISGNYKIVRLIKWLINLTTVYVKSSMHFKTSNTTVDLQNCSVNVGGPASQRRNSLHSCQLWFYGSFHDVCLHSHLVLFPDVKLLGKCNFTVSMWFYVALLYPLTTARCGERQTC